MEIPHYFFVATLGNSTSFLINPYKFRVLFLWYHWTPPCHPVWIFSGIAQLSNCFLSYIRLFFIIYLSGILVHRQVGRVIGQIWFILVKLLGDLLVQPAVSLLSITSGHSDRWCVLSLPHVQEYYLWLNNCLTVQIASFTWLDLGDQLRPTCSSIAR